MEQISQFPERWFSTKEMCAYLGVTHDTLLAWINEKGKPAHKVGRGWKYKPSEVDEWIKSGKATEEKEGDQYENSVFTFERFAYKVR